MNHVLILPILLPLFMGAILMCGFRLSDTLKRTLSVLSTWALLPIAICLVLLAERGEVQLYALGNWQAPFGIVLMLDRLNALMLLLSAVLAGFVVLYACRGEDRQGPNFHSLFQFQLLGINGAFLTGDLFNLFVFFEILLIASYSLLMQGNRAKQIKAGIHYVVLNLLGSSLFLIGVALLYGLLGTLNMADLAVKVADVEADRAPLVAAAGYLLLIVFGLKAAVLPLQFWLPNTYAAAPASVAALFAIMTKVGLYAIIRVFTLLYGSAAGELAGLAHTLLWWLALPTIALGALGVLAATRLQVLLGHLVVVSVGTLLAGFALGTPQALIASLYYLVHSTLVAGAFFLVAGLVVEQRGKAGGELVKSQAVRQPLLLGSVFFIAAVSVAGLPPFSGFLGKLLLLRSAGFGLEAAFLWTVILVGGLVVLIGLSRAGSHLFWRSTQPAEPGEKVDGLRLLAVIGLLSGSLVLVVMAQPVLVYIQKTAVQLFDLAPYLALVTGGQA